MNVNVNVWNIACALLDLRCRRAQHDGMQWFLRACQSVKRGTPQPSYDLEAAERRIESWVAETYGVADDAATLERIEEELYQAALLLHELNAALLHPSSDREGRIMETVRGMMA